MSENDRPIIPVNPTNEPLNPPSSGLKLQVKFIIYQAGDGGKVAISRNDDGDVVIEHGTALPTVFKNPTAAAEHLAELSEPGASKAMHQAIVRSFVRDILMIHDLR
jgi:hypothetical protein